MLGEGAGGGDESSSIVVGDSSADGSLMAEEGRESFLGFLELGSLGGVEGDLIGGLLILVGC